MKLIFCGHGEFGYTALNALIEDGKNIVHVFTHPSTFKNPNDPHNPDLERLAKEHCIPCSVITKQETAYMAEQIEELAPDILVSVTWRALFPQSVIDKPKIAAFNIHGSKLPKLRGNAPIAWAIINGDKQTAITAHMLDAGMDTGDIIQQNIVNIDYEDDVATLSKKMLRELKTLVNDAVDKLSDTAFKPTPQNHSQATIAKKRRPEDGLIDWHKSTEELYNWVRALTHPLPGAFTFNNSHKIQIWKSEPMDFESPHPIGSVIKLDNKSFSVKTSNGALKITSYTGTRPKQGDILKSCKYDAVRD